MTIDKNDDRNWVVAVEDENGFRIVYQHQAENIAREWATAFCQNEVRHGTPVFLYERKGTVKTEPVARWQ